MINILEKRKIEAGALRALCFERDWYTKGSNEAFTNLLTRAENYDNLTKEAIYLLADDIIRHSSEHKLAGQEIEDVCFAIAEVSITTFERMKKEKLPYEAEFNWILNCAQSEDLNVEIAKNQLKALWTAFCIHQNRECDTYPYDDEIRKVWEVVQANHNSPWERSENGFEEFDFFMGSDLS